MSIWFKNLQLFTMAPSWEVSPAKLEEALAAHPLLPCNAASMQSQGWQLPTPDSGWVYKQDSNMLVTLGVQQKLLPAAVINQAAKQKAAQIEQQQGFALGRKQMRDLKERIADELRPRAFVREKSIRAWLDPARRRFIVDSPTPKVAEEVAGALRTDLGEFPATPLITQTAVSAAMTTWLMAGRVSAEFALDQDCELIGGEQGAAAVRYVRHGLDGAEIRSLIKGGKTVSKLGLIWRERLSFVLTEKLAIKRLRFQAMDDDGSTDQRSSRQTEADEFDASVTLMIGELGGLLDDLITRLGGLQT
ncbi:MAG: recombination-associated protein RdgC [Nevskia sp.]|nr:recombination-associated protein RdgC [Nevskia sp.]